MIRGGYNLLDIAVVAAVTVALVLVTLRVSDHYLRCLTPDLRILTRRVLIALWLFCGLAAILVLLHISLAPIIVGSALSLALSLGFQPLLSDLVAGAWVLIEQPFQVGQEITVLDAEGIVVDIGLRTTAIQGAGRKHIIPNMLFMTTPVTLLPPRSPFPESVINTIKEP